MFENFWLPRMVRVAAIALFAILFKEFLKKRAGQSAVEGSADNDSATENGTVETASRTCTSPQVNETATSSGYDYEVFLSFRGPDTRSGFTDYLYTSLTNVGIRTFKDDNELRVGKNFAQELPQAINQSKILIPIFSRGYASSIWCLEELVHMVKCQQNGRQKILPIFYDVTPSEVRHQILGYGEAFHSHEKKKRYPEETISQWKAALDVVGDLMGWDLSSKTKRREGELVNEVTEEVFRELKKAYLLVSDCLVSVDKHVNVIMEKLDAQTSETRIIGIHGMGGIGKTTTAKIIYNKLLENFEGCCFLSNIRERSERKGIECLQNQLISDILKTKWTDIKYMDEGIQTIKGRLSSKRILLLLDDVHEKNHMDALVGGRDWFGKGSKIIITTRNKEILDVLKVDDHYELTSMDDDQSLQLFSKHAFRRDSPLDEYINQSKKAVGIAGGLPLALEVIGSLLSRTKKEEWNGKLKELENVPPEDVQSRLKISYKALGVLEQHIFLDIACLFIGYDKDILVHFWDESIHFLKKTMDVLENMSLIKIEKYNRVWMHDQLRDLGRQIVREESRMKIEKQSRVWNLKEALHLLRKHEGRKKVEALRLKFDHEGQHHFTSKDFKGLPNLRFLEVAGSIGNFCVEERLLWHESPSDVLSTNDFQENLDLLPQLRWLSWHDIPPAFNITIFSVDNVVILDLSRSKITDDWKGWSHVKVMKNLKILHMSYCKCLQRTPNFSTLSNLERLILQECTSLIEIDRSICRLTCLVSLDVSYCGNLQRLPDELGEGLASLKYLSLQQCSSLERLPNSIGNLESLIELDISNTSIKELPDSVENLKKLKVVKMRNSRLKKIPNVLWSMGDLEDIVATRKAFASRKAFAIDRLFHVQIGNGIHGSQSLRILVLENADIHALPRLPESLINLRMSILRMGTFPDLSNLTNLKLMDLDFGRPHHDGISNGLGEHPMPWWFGNLSKLEFLALRSHHGTTSPTNLTLPPQLKSLRLECPNLRCLPRLPSSLSSLNLKDCKSLCSMEDLSNLKKLSSIYISSTTVAEIQGLGCLGNLRDLMLHQLGQVKILPDLSNLNKLKSLRVEYCDKLVEIQGQLPRFLDFFQVAHCGSLQKLPNLSSLMDKRTFLLHDCKNLKVETILDVARLNPRHFEFVKFEQLQILDLSNLNELRHLYVHQCDNLVEIQGELPQSLATLAITSCKSLRKLSNLSSSTRLQEVHIGHCNDLVEIQGELPQSLEKLEITYCVSLQKLPYLSSLTRLRKVCIHDCNDLVEIQGKLPQSLEVLEINSCKSLQKLPDLSSSMGLREVHIGYCNDLVEIQGELPQSLEKVVIFSCVSLQKLPYLSSLIGLQEVCIRNCDDLVEIPGELPHSLEVLKIYSSCKSLRKFPYLSSLMRLREFYINHCNDLVEIQGELPQSLEKLEIFYCVSLQKLPYLSSLTRLREVAIKNCDNLVEIPGELPRSLEILTIDSSCKSLQKLPYLLSLTRLREVFVRHYNDLVEIQGELPQSLEKLWIFYCGSLQKLPCLSSLIGLRNLAIENCDNLGEIPGELPQCLEKLEFVSCKSLHKIPMSSSMGLQTVYIKKCSNLVEILGELPQCLETLLIGCCEFLQKLPYLSSSMGLQEVDIHNCDNLVKIEGELPQCLKKLRIAYCKSLQKLPYLSSSMGLQEVDIHNCDNLVEIQGELPQSLEVLDICECQSLQELPNLLSLDRLQRVTIKHCGKLNVEAISSLCLEESVKFVGDDTNFSRKLI